MPAVSSPPSALSGACNSPVRSGWAVGGEPFIQSSGCGAYAYDEDGKRYIDYVMAYGPLLFGYNDPRLTGNVEQLTQSGVLFGSTHRAEESLAERICALLPSIEQIRFVTTGTEAMMSAVRVARAYTGRELVVRFAGNYHGHFDAALQNAGASACQMRAGRSGIPQSVASDVAVARYNDLACVDTILERNAQRCAAILVEPVCANMGLVMPEHGFLQGLRERADAAGALLIFDEVITWPRFGRAGAQGVLGVIPDLTALGKVLGGGFPFAAYGGRPEVMSALAPQGAVFSGGTHAGYPFGTAMAHRVLDVLQNDAALFERMRLLAQQLAGGIQTIFEQRGVPYAVVQAESIVDFAFRGGPPSRNYDDAQAADTRMFAAYYHEMRRRGILLPPSPNEVMFISGAHTAADIDQTLTAIDETFEVLR